MKSLLEIIKTPRTFKAGDKVVDASRIYNGIKVYVVDGDEGDTDYPLATIDDSYTETGLRYVDAKYRALITKSEARECGLLPAKSKIDPDDKDTWPNKMPVVYWDTDDTCKRHVGFWDKQNGCLFTYHGQISGMIYSNHKPISPKLAKKIFGKEAYQKALEALDALED